MCGAPLAPVSVTLTTAPGTALGIFRFYKCCSYVFKELNILFQGGEDYSQVEKNLTFAVGLGTVECVYIPILNDECLEDMSEVFTVSISSDTERVIVQPSASSVEVTIVDNDGQ